MPASKSDFESLFDVIMEDAEFLEEGPPNVPWDDQEELASGTREIALNIINKDGRLLPFVYQAAYVHPLKESIDLVIAQDRINHTRPIRPLWDLETLLGAIYDHADEEVAAPVQQFLAVTSNVYRSFLDADSSAAGRLPERPGPVSVPPDKWLPPLAFFKHKMNLATYDVAPYIVPSDTIKKVFGGKVAVVCLPSCYRQHPLLWMALAHEVGGHGVLHTFDQLLSQLQDGVFDLLKRSKLPHKQILAKLWRYWTEETTCDVFAVMNVGPSYGKALAIYHAALGKSVKQMLVCEEFFDLNKEPEQWRDSMRALGLKKMFEQLTKFEDFEKLVNKRHVEDLSLRTWSGLPPEYRNTKSIRDLERDGEVPDLDPHPIDLLKLHVVIGAIEGLRERLPEEKNYIRELEGLAALCGKGRDTVQICGYVQTDVDTWELVDRETFPGKKDLPLAEMQESARMVGRYLAATAAPQALGGANIQAYESWSKDDEETAERIKEAFMKAESVDSMGDDAQLLAGATLAVFEQPDHLRYREISDQLGYALVKSFYRDPFWGSNSVVHPIFTWPLAPDTLRKRYQRKLHR